jgi:hypothetical protein
MFRKQIPKLDAINLIKQTPHCDARVLHAPGECEYCDRHPEWQALRLLWGICFTGYEPDPGELPCPATVKRSLEVINKWPGNMAKFDKQKDYSLQGQVDSLEEDFEELSEKVREEIL